MKLIPRILLTAGLMMALLFSAGTCPAEEAFAVEDTGLDLAETLSVHYPALTGGENEELTQQINDLIRELSGKHIENISIEDPSLEDMFMHFYEGGKERV